MRACLLPPASPNALPPRVPPSASGKPGGNSIPRLTHPVISLACDRATLCHHIRATALSGARGAGYVEVYGTGVVTVPM
eukprot:363534-Prymnesium_polylepis.2